MAETDILNPRKGYDPDFGDSLNPNYGWNRDRPSTLAIIKPAFGKPYSRESADGGHTYKLNYTRRNLKVTERLKQFFEQFEQGFFTLIDHDIGRHYVGRFEGAMPQSIEAFGRFTSQGWNFVEVPGAPMLEYPADFDRWGIIQRPWDDWGDAWTASGSTIANAWTQPANVVGDDGISRPVHQLINLAPSAGDWATHEYRGYGFRLWALVGPAYGLADLFVDGVLVATLNCNSNVDQGPQVVYQNTEMPLDIHRVQVVVRSIPLVGSLVGAFTDAGGNVLKPVAIGKEAVLTPPDGATQLQFGVNDVDWAGNTGSWTIAVNGANHVVPGTALPWKTGTGLNAAYPLQNQNGTDPVAVAVNPGEPVSVIYVNGTITVGPGNPNDDAGGHAADGVVPTAFEWPGSYVEGTDISSPRGFAWDKLEVIR